MCLIKSITSTSKILSNYYVCVCNEATEICSSYGKHSKCQEKLKYNSDKIERVASLFNFFLKIHQVIRNI
jgi:hypothetical protein